MKTFFQTEALKGTEYQLWILEDYVEGIIRLVSFA